MDITHRTSYLFSAASAIGSVTVKIEKVPVINDGQQITFSYFASRGPEYESWKYTYNENRG